MPISARNRKLLWGRSAGCRDTVASSLQDMTDWMDIWSSLDGPAEQLRAERDFARSLRELHDAGLVVDAGIRHQLLEGGIGGPPSRWKTAVFVVSHAEPA